jgi:thiol-disulfide isomerase/thioredoxin
MTAKRSLILVVCACLLRLPHAWAAESQVRPAHFISVEQLRTALGSHKGRVLVVHFWATWCQPCMQELPMLAKLARESSPRGVDFLPISLDNASERAAFWVGRVLARKTGDAGWSPILKWDEGESFTELFDSRWQGEIPVFFVYDRDGRLRRYMVGDLGRGDFERLVGDLLPPASQ